MLASPDLETEFFLSLIGKPWANQARGPEAFDCWGLVVWCYKHALKIDLPNYLTLDSKDVIAVAKRMTHGLQSREWEALATPEALCLVAMSSGRAFHHVGVWLPLDGGVVLHSADGFGVRAQSPFSLSSTGLQNQKYYRYVSSRSNQ